MNNQTYTLLAKSSSGSNYEVKFAFIGDRLSVTCLCVAGSLKQLCKHKDAFLLGDPSMLFDDTQEDLLNRLCEMVKLSNYQSEFANYQAQMADLEIRKKQLASEGKQIKAMFARKLSEGL